MASSRRARTGRTVLLLSISAPLRLTIHSSTTSTYPTRLVLSGTTHTCRPSIAMDCVARLSSMTLSILTVYSMMSMMVRFFLLMTLEGQRIFCHYFISVVCNHTFGLVPYTRTLGRQIPVSPLPSFIDESKLSMPLPNQYSHVSSHQWPWTLQRGTSISSRCCKRSQRPEVPTPHCVTLM